MVVIDDVDDGYWLIIWDVVFDANWWWWRRMIGDDLDCCRYLMVDDDSLWLIIMMSCVDYCWWYVVCGDGLWRCMSMLVNVYDVCCMMFYADGCWLMVYAGKCLMMYHVWLCGWLLTVDCDGWMQVLLMLMMYHARWSMTYRDWSWCCVVVMIDDRWWSHIVGYADWGLTMLIDNYGWAR